MARDMPITIGEVFHLLWQGKTHMKATLEEIDHAVLSAAPLGKLLCWRAPQTGQLVGLMSYAILPPEREQAYLTNNALIGGDDFKVDEGGELYVLDFVAPHGAVAKMVKNARNYFARKYGEGVTCNWKRIGRPRPKLGYAVMREYDAPD